MLFGPRHDHLLLVQLLHASIGMEGFLFIVVNPYQLLAVSLAVMDELVDSCVPHPGVDGLCDGLPRRLHREALDLLKFDRLRAFGMVVVPFLGAQQILAAWLDQVPHLKLLH